MSEETNPRRDRQLSDLIAALIDGSIDDAQFQQLEDCLRDDPAARQLYLDQLQIHEDLPEVAFPADRVEIASRQQSAEPLPSAGLTLWQAGLAIAIMLPIAFLIGTLLPRGTQPVVLNTDNGVSGVQFANLAHAKFFGEMPPKMQSSPQAQRDYVLMEGMVELSFPAGASAIIEGPAVFRVESDERLALDMGRCSVHAPDGAEGFQVDTPDVQVVDRGTRFSVNVSEDNATEVQVVEGAADVYGKMASAKEAALNPPLELRILPAEARRFSYADPSQPIAVAFKPDQYQRQLPDRVVSYEATTADDGRIDQLTRLLVQRGGKQYNYPVEALIPSRVTHFHAQENHGYLIGDAKLPDDRTQFASDRSLRTGLINIGGSRQPLTENPDLSADEANGTYGTPGLAVRFDRPVQNGPGDDVVLFEIQMFSNPLSGDAFHVSPLKFASGLKSHTVTRFDLTLESPEAFPLQTLHLQKFEQLPRSLDELQTFACTPVVQAVKFRAIAVGIDLSDLGYAEGAPVDGLFFQDAMNDEDVVDPTFIAGLPAELP